MAPATTKGPSAQRDSSASSRTRCLESMLLERLVPPKEVRLFGQFEELCKLYSIEAPFASRSQIELMFDVYDGRKLESSSLLDGDPLGALDADSSPAATNPLESSPVVDHHQHATSKSNHLQRPSTSAQRLQTVLSLSNTTSRRPAKRNGLWLRHLSSRLTTSSGKSSSGLALGCCLARSETGHSLSSGMTQSSSGASWAQRAAAAEAESLALGREPDDEPELVGLKEDARRIIGPLLSQMSASYSTRQLAGELAANAMQPATSSFNLVVDSLNQSQRVSVCLLPKKRLLQIQLRAEGARHFAREDGRIREILWKQRGVARSGSLEQRLDRYLHKTRSMTGGRQRVATKLKLAKGELEQLISLTKNSLSHLLDAQLMLRNRLTAERQARDQMLQNNQTKETQQNQLILWNSSGDYDILLRNNFNLLKIWQNLEETKRLVCFVCEPIKTNLADLFWFSRQRTSAQALGPCGSCHSQLTNCLLTSPFVCQDANQVKRGLLQILEALNYLHSICKLIHRNLNPRNILVAADDNWRLAGLEFALRFESATINQADSIMAKETSSFPRYTSSSGSGSRATLRRQTTLHQSKCEEFIRRPKSWLQQPEVDYLAPEMWRNAKCSHKSDMFSYGLILAQTYDLLRHKSPISCRQRAQNYETELKRLQERRKRKLSRLVPSEMREPLLEMLDEEPTMRPSANLALQLFRRPIELCSENDESLRHLRSSLGYLNTRCLNSGHYSNTGASVQPNNPGSSSGGGDKKRLSYFRKVTSAAAAANTDRPSAGHKRLTRNLNLLNLLMRGVDSLANQCTNSMAIDASTLEMINNNNGNQPSYLAFALLKQQFEFTLESLRQLYASSLGSETFALSDSRNLLLSLALHRRLLEQLSQMRAELPQVSRLAGAALLQTNRLGQNHRSLTESEDKLQCLVSKHSLPRFSLVLSDPLLKLDEFLLVYELVNDLLAFVGQKCRQNFSLRGKQLLNDLTPLTGCPSLSSSEEDDEDSVRSGGGDICASTLTTSRQQHGSEIIINSSKTMSQHHQQNRMSNHRFSEYEDPIRRQQQYGASQSTAATSAGSRYLNNFPTKISITAPSPMGSVRDVHGLTSDSPLERSFNDLSREQQNAPRIRHTVDDQYVQIVERTSQLNLSNCGQSIRSKEGSVGSGSGNDSNFMEDEEEEHLDQPSGGDNETRDGAKSRSQLIDELLKTINEDSFNDLTGGLNSRSQTGAQLSATQLANMSRPKSACSSGSTASAGQNKGYPSSSQQRGSTSSGQRPNSLALNNNNQRSQQIRPPGATFDNVIRRMSTNIVQNFNKMSNSLADQQDNSNSNGGGTALRKERSSNINPSNNLYVDNQVPVRRHSDNTINVPRIQVALSSPQSTSRLGLNQRASVSASKLANKWKLSTKTNRRESSDKLSPNLSGALGYIRRHSSGNAAGNEQNQSNGQNSSSIFNSSPFKTKSSSNLGLDFLLSNRSMKRRCSAASMIGHQTQRKAEDLLDAGMKSVQNMFG